VVGCDGCTDQLQGVYACGGERLRMDCFDYLIRMLLERRSMGVPVPVHARVFLLLSMERCG